MKLLAVVAVVALLLAGCGGKGGDRTVKLDTGQVIETEEKIEAGKGFVHGLVGDDAVQLIPDVTIRLVGTEHETLTGADGTFLLVNVEPAIYVLEGEKRDYATVQTTVVVEEGKVAKAVLLMERLPTTVPYCFTIVHHAHIDASVGGVNNVAGNQTRKSFDMDREAETVLIESTWTGEMHGLTEDPLFYRLTVLRSQEWFIEGVGPNPLIVAIDGNTIPPNEPQLRVDVTPAQTGQAVILADGETYISVFVNAPAPADFSVLDGSSCVDYNALFK